MATARRSRLTPGSPISPKLRHASSRMLRRIGKGSTQHAGRVDKMRCGHRDDSNFEIR
jgi:hypothetical protein